MWRAGFRVPPGFCVTTRSYRSHVERHDLGDRLQALAAGGRVIAVGTTSVRSLECDRNKVERLLQSIVRFGAGKPQEAVAGVAELAVSSAFHDPRLPALRADDLDDDLDDEERSVEDLVGLPP